MSANRHPHAGLMLEYAKAAMHTRTPWMEWEENRYDGMGWRLCSTTPSWEPWCEYRRTTAIPDGEGQQIDSMMHDLPFPMQVETARIICSELWRAGYRKITIEN